MSDQWIAPTFTLVGVLLAGLLELPGALATRDGRGI